MKQRFGLRPTIPTAPSGQGRRPQPVALSNRFRFCPAAMNSASMFTFARPRSRNCRSSCHCFASPKSGSIHTFRQHYADHWRQIAWINDNDWQFERPVKRYQVRKAVAKTLIALAARVAPTVTQPNTSTPADETILAAPSFL